MTNFRICKNRLINDHSDAVDLIYFENSYPSGLKQLQ